jgi:hypothetical protein
MTRMILVLAAVVCLSIPASANEKGFAAGPGRGIAELLKVLLLSRSSNKHGIGNRFSLPAPTVRFSISQAA